MVLNPRKAKLLEELPKNNWKVKPSAIKAGYSPIYADKQANKILKSALKDQAKDIVERISANSPVDTKTLKKSLAEIIGLSSESVYERLRFIATQEKDLGSALKVLAPLSKDLGVNLTEDTPKTIVPILNIGVKQVEAIETVDTTLLDGSVEP